MHDLVHDFAQVEVDGSAVSQLKLADVGEARKVDTCGKKNALHLIFHFTGSRMSLDENNDEHVLEALQPPPNLHRSRNHHNIGNYSTRASSTISIKAGGMMAKASSSSSSVMTIMTNAKFELKKFDGTNNFGMWQCEVLDVLY
ncbi:hypothetical protein WN944_021674 [Citrus x changshan-huyou]|uniref:Uncharacterized protein n=1 Tax=Citrus x changshan-huyou TaxID=2935761 RepID=A0AAP0QZQ9_9ROSI